MITIVFGKAAQFLIALAMLRVATTLLSPAEMGKVSLILTTTAFFALFLVNPVGMFINRRLHAWQSSGVARHYLIRYAGYLLLVALVAFVALTVFYATGLADFGVSLAWLICLVCGSLIFNTINQTAIPSLNLLGSSGMFVLLSLLTVSASFACATLLVNTGQPSAQSWLLGLLLGQGLLSIIGTKILFDELKSSELLKQYPSIQKRHLQTLFRFAWPVAIAAGLGWVQGQGYRYIIEGQLGLTQLGIFVAGYGISAGIIAGFESILTTYFQPRLYRDVSIGNPSEIAHAWQRYASAVIPSMLLTVAAIIILAPELTQIFLGKHFQSAADYVVWGALAEAARMLIGVYSLIAHMQMRTRWLMLPNFFGAITALGLCAVLIPSFGAMGAGIGLAASGFGVVLTMHAVMAKHVGGGIGIRAIILAGIGGITLWGATLFIKNLFNANSWPAIISLLVGIGSIYLVMQYLFMKNHIKDKQ